MKRFAIPFLKEGGKEIASAVAKTVIPNIPKYMQAAKEDSVHGLVTTAIGDLAPVIKNVVLNKMRGGSLPFSHERLQEMYEDGFPTSMGGIEGTIESCIANCRPYIRKLMQPLVLKMQLLNEYHTKSQAGDNEGAEEAVRKLYQLTSQFGNNRDTDSEFELVRLVETMMQTALRGAEMQGYMADKDRGGSVLAMLGTALLPKVIDKVSSIGVNFLGNRVSDAIGAEPRGGAIGTPYGQNVRTIFPGKVIVSDDMITDTMTEPSRLLSAGPHACLYGKGKGRGMTKEWPNGRADCVDQQMDVDEDDDRGGLILRNLRKQKGWTLPQAIGVAPKPGDDRGAGLKPRTRVPLLLRDKKEKAKRQKTKN
ncbi:MAG: hypothetical protein ACRC0J_11355 [Shewanella oncorhynchi]